MAARAWGGITGDMMSSDASGKVQIRSLFDVDHRLGHGAAERIVEDRDLHAGHLHPAANDEQHDEKQDERFHGAIMPHTPDQCDRQDQT